MICKSLLDDDWPLLLVSPWVTWLIHWRPIIWLPIVGLSIIRLSIVGLAIVWLSIIWLAIVWLSIVGLSIRWNLVVNDNSLLTIILIACCSGLQFLRFFTSVYAHSNHDTEKQKHAPNHNTSDGSTIQSLIPIIVFAFCVCV